MIYVLKNCIMQLQNTNDRWVSFFLFSIILRRFFNLQVKLLHNLQLARHINTISFLIFSYDYVPAISNMLFCVNKWMFSFLYFVELCYVYKMHKWCVRYIIFSKIEPEFWDKKIDIKENETFLNNVYIEQLSHIYLHIESLLKTCALKRLTKKKKTENIIINFVLFMYLRRYNWLHSNEQTWVPKCTRTFSLSRYNKHININIRFPPVLISIYYHAVSSVGNVYQWICL